MSFLLGRSAYTHELAYYAKPAVRALKAAMPELPTSADAESVNADNYRDFLAAWQAKLGTEIDLPESLRDCLADEKNCLDTADEMAPGRVIPIVLD